MSQNEEIIWEPDGQADDDLSEPSRVVAESPNVDLYAYYLPFHFYRRRWGVYIKASGILAIAAHLSKERFASSLTYYQLNSVFRVLLEHELFHHRVELACARAEIPMLDLLRANGVPDSPYQWYFFDSDGGLHEEAMANANAIRELGKWQAKASSTHSKNRAFEARMSSFLESQPAGYRDFGLWVDDRRFRLGKEKVIDEFRRSLLPRALKVKSDLPSGLVPGHVYFRERGVQGCPVYLVMDSASRHLRRVRPFPRAFGMRILVHTNDHPPPHVHLERPVGKEYGRYSWPDFEPLKGAAPIPRALKKDLGGYLEEYGKGIGNKIDEVYSQSG